MTIVYESRISLSSFWCKLYCSGGVKTLSDYLKGELKGSTALTTLKLEPKKDIIDWFILRYGTGRQRKEIPVGFDSLIEKETLERVSFELGWIDSKEWDGGQVSWRLDSFQDRKPLSVCSHVVVASRTAETPRFSVTNGTAEFTWVPLHALFSDLHPDARFVGWKKASADAKRLELEKVDEAHMFETLFPPVYRDHVRTLLHLPIAVGKKIVKTVDFRNAQPKALEPLLLRSDTESPDTLFYAMVTFRAEIGVSNDGRLLAFPRLPYRRVLTQFVELKRRNISEGADVVPVDTVERQPNWYASFPIVNTSNYYRLNMATLDIFDSFECSNFIQQYIFPHSPSNLPISVVKKFFTWRMKWAYTFCELVTIPLKSRKDFKSKVYISLLKPWY